MAVNMKGNFKKVKLKVKEYTEIQKLARNQKEMIGERKIMLMRPLEEKRIESGRAKHLSKHKYMKMKHRKTMND